MMEKFSINNILKITTLDNEYELEQASSLFNKLRTLIQDDPSLKPLRLHLSNLIEQYEEQYWSDENNVTKEQIDESDRAERLVQFQNELVGARKERIRKALMKLGLIQNDLALLLGHRKNYMSELINGVRPFSQEDIIVMHRILGIKLEHLIIPVIKEKVAVRLRSVIKELNNTQLKLKETDLKLEIA